MKFSAQEEYGIRCLIRIAKAHTDNKGMTIPEISQAEELSHHNVAKLLRILRINGFLDSERGQAGGYTLSKPPNEIKIRDVLVALGGKLFDDNFCLAHTGVSTICTNSIDCSTRSLWRIIQEAVDSVLSDFTLEDMLVSEDTVYEKLSTDIINNPPAQPA